MVPAQGWHALIEKVSTFFLSPGSHVFFTLVSSSCFPDQHICADIPITHRWQVAGCSNPLKYWFQKTTIWFMLLACFPEHIHVESCVEKKSNQRFLKLQFLYFIGMEAWRLLFSHNFVKTWPVSKETGLFYVSMIVFVCLCAKQKKTHTRSEDLQNHVFDLTHLQLDNPVLYSDNMVSIEPGCVGCILKPLASGGASFSRTGHSLRWTKGTFNFCVDVLSVLVYCPVCGLGVNQGNNQSEMGWTGPGWSHRAAHNSCSGQFKDRSTEQSEGVSNSMAWTGEAFLFYIFPCEHCFHITIHMCCWYTPPRCPDHSYPHYSPQVACLPVHVGA